MSIVNTSNQVQITTGLPANITDWSMCGWVYEADWSTSGWARCGCIFNSGTVDYIQLVRQNGDGYQWQNPGGSTQFNALPAWSGWMFFAWSASSTRNPGTLTTVCQEAGSYYDGQSAGTDADNAIATPTTISLTDNMSGQAWCHIKMWSAALTLDQLKAEKMSRSVVHTDDLWGWWPMDQGSLSAALVDEYSTHDFWGGDSYSSAGPTLGARKWLLARPT